MSDRACTATSHEWPETWASGDTCNCGDLYLTKDEAGGMRIDEALEAEEEALEAENAEEEDPDNAD